ncbi:tRNA lysidine(34) synthetase TilS [Sinomicrobium oceani]|uniref:tRNA lysidine(34) synthetase TilS n=1 Tax=Sinomicrobium oceani TaxID=1150368 RepID=UPI00227A5602|nr:tRNA lysidine(34) synthetase TilS [Sinomicrobium oceani]
MEVFLALEKNFYFSRMLASFEEHIDKHFPFLRQARLLIAISGGIDSVVLARLCDQSGMKIALAHCNFHLRGADSDDDEEFVRKLGTILNVPVYTQHFDTRKYAAEKGMSIQLAARELRYAWFGRLLGEGKGAYLLTAHHADDSLETFLINLSRGTGIEGLSGIPAVNGKIIRPLLPFSRETLKGYLLEQQWTWREDVSNSDTKYLRNKIRHQMVPELKSLSPDFLKQFGRTQQHLAECGLIVENYIEGLRKDLFRQEGDRRIVAVDKLEQLHPQETCLYYLFREFSFPVAEIQKLLRAMSGKKITSEKFIMVRDREHLLIEPIAQEETGASYFFITDDIREIGYPVRLLFSEGDNDVINPGNGVTIDKDKLNYPLKLRKWEKGDYFYPLGMTNRKKLSKFFKDEKVPVLDKNNTWLLCSGDAIVWVIGYRLDNRFKVTAETVNTLKISIHSEAKNEN